MILNINSAKILLINSYFPVDPQLNNYDESELIETLSYVRQVLLNNDYDHIIWAGDLNADFLRNSKHTRIVQHFIEELNLLKAWDKYDVNFTHYHEPNGVSFTSTLDHFLDAGAIHLPSNTSDHLPIYCKIKTDYLQPDKVSTTEATTFRPSWGNSTAGEKLLYKLHAKHLLENISIPEILVNCTDVKCNKIEHIEASDKFMVEVLNAVECASLTTLNIPHMKGNSCKSVPGWTELVKTFKETAYFWHQVWQSAGRPINCQLHSVMKHTRNRYHYELRKCKKAENKIRRNQLLNACVNGNGDIFEEIKNIRKSSPATASSMDGHFENIEEHFQRT